MSTQMKSLNWGVKHFQTSFSEGSRNDRGVNIGKVHLIGHTESQAALEMILRSILSAESLLVLTAEVLISLLIQSFNKQHLWSLVIKAIATDKANPSAEQWSSHRRETSTPERSIDGPGSIHETRLH